MNRREFVKSSAAAALALTLDIKGQAAPKATRPNVLYVFSDQHRAQSLPGEAFNQAMAPNIDAFRRQNFSNYPLCTPYRGILISGRCLARTGLIHNNVPLSPEEVTIAHTFQKNGYRTGYVGMWHLAGHGEAPGFIPKGPRRMGFEDWHVWDATNLHYHAWTYNQDTGEKILPEGWQPIRMTDEAIQFLQKQDKDKPWLLMLSWNPPHPPFNPPPEDAAPYPVDKLKLRPNVMTRPAGVETMGGAHFLVSEESIQSALQEYYGGITGVDQEFGRILKALEETGQADDTVAIYTSDHGEMMGSHGRMSKQVPFEESCRVPFFCF